MTVLFIVLQSLLALYYVFSGTSKTIGVQYWIDIFKNLGIPQWFRVVTGVVQLVGAALLIIGYWYSDAVTWACIWLGITMLLACLAHFRVEDPIGKTAPALMFTALIIILTIVNASV